MLQIDEEVVRSMNDEQLQKLGLKHFGDRIALINYCKVSAVSTSKMVGLLERVKDKLENNNMPSRPATRSQRLIGNKNAKKIEKYVEIGFLVEGTQVRSKKGGGTRKLKCNVDNKLSVIMKEGIDLFFPGGVSAHHGRKSKYDFHVVNFDSTHISSDCTVEELYESVKPTSNLKVYLKAEKRGKNEEENDQQRKKLKLDKNTDNVITDLDNNGVIRVESTEKNQDPRDVISVESSDENELNHSEVKEKTEQNQSHDQNNDYVTSVSTESEENYN